MALAAGHNEERKTRQRRKLVQMPVVTNGTTHQVNDAMCCIITVSVVSAKCWRGTTEPRFGSDLIAGEARMDPHQSANHSRVIKKCSEVPIAVPAELTTVTFS